MMTNANTSVLSPSNSLMINPSDRRWEDFIKSQSNATIFHHPAWINLLADCYGYQPFIAAVSDEAGNIRAGTPIMEIKSWMTGYRWVSLPFSDYCNPLFDDNVWLSRLREGLIHLSQKKDISRVELRWDFSTNRSIPASSRYVLHNLELDSNIESVLNHAHRTQRQNIRRAEKEGVQIEWGKSLNDMRVFYHQQCITRHRHGLPVQPWKFFELLFHHLLEKDLGFILLAKKDGCYLATGIFLHTEQTLTYKYAASNESGNQDLRSNHLLTWNAIRWGCENGFRRLDFGRSDVDNLGLRTYKKRWGAQESTLTYSYFSVLPIRQTTSKFIPLVQSVIRRSPPWMGTMIGELLYRHLG